MVAGDSAVGRESLKLVVLYSADLRFIRSRKRLVNSAMGKPRLFPGICDTLTCSGALMTFLAFSAIGERRTAIFRPTIRHMR